MNPRDLNTQYRDLLLKGIVPFWLNHGIDSEFGGVLSCMTETGVVLSGDKYIWSQARSLWTFAAIYNRIERDPRLLDAARNSLRFLLAHGRDEQGRWVYHTSRSGEVIEGATSIYSDCFAIYGLNELYRATGEQHLLDLARETHSRVLERIARPDFRETAPYRLPPGRKAHAVPMILLEVTNELAITTGAPAFDIHCERFATEIMTHFVREDRGLLLEYLDSGYRELPPPEGTFVNPGHTIESMWFVLHWARRTGRKDVIVRAAEVIRRHLEAGWDPEYGGIFLGIDADGEEPFLAHSEKKAWWPHTEALYALLLAERLTGAEWASAWYDRVHRWSWTHFHMPEVGEWRQRLDRTGTPIEEVIALPVKDPFHLPRAAVLIVQLLSEPD